MTDVLIGKQLGDYQIRGLLGRGGMARVYAGYDAHLDRLAAVKVIANDYAPEDRAEYFERFQREARAIARLNHPNIVGVYQFGQYEDLYYMAMVFVEGRDLRQVLRDYHDHDKIMPFSDVLNVARGIGSALDYAHARGVIHRDVKPSNIMIARDKRAVLTDFGLALSSSDSTLGETFGSAHYIAPEQAISSANATAQSDLYSLGVCVYEMLTGRVPFDDPSAMTVALKHLQEAPVPPRQINPEITPAVEYVLLRALEKEPNRRYASGVEFARALKAAYEGQTLPETQQLQIAPVPNPFSPPGSKVVAAGTASIATSGAIGTASNRAGQAGAGLATSTVTLAPDTGPSPVDPDLESWDDTPTPANASVSRPGRRSSPRRVLVALVVIIVIIAAVLLATGILTPHSTPGALGSTAQTTTPGTAIAANASPAATGLVAIPLGTRSATLASSTSGKASHTPSAVPPSATPPPTAKPPSPPPTSLPISAGNPVSTSAGTTAATAAATIATPSAGGTAASTGAATGSANSTGGIPAQLVYDNDQLDLINISTTTVINGDILNQITFLQSATARSFAASLWTQNLANHSLPVAGCVQVFRTQYTTLPGLAGCSRALVYRRTIDAHLFWTVDAAFVTDTPPTSFTVEFAGKSIALCQIKDGLCNFTVPTGS